MSLYSKKQYLKEVLTEIEEINNLEEITEEQKIRRDLLQKQVDGFLEGKEKLCFALGINSNMTFLGALDTLSVDKLFN